MDFFSDFSSLWHRTSNLLFLSPQCTAPLTTPSATFQDITQSSHKGKASMLHILRQHYFQYRSVAERSCNDAVGIPKLPSCPSSRLALGSGDEHMENCSLVYLFQNRHFFDYALVPSTSSLRCNESPEFSVTASDTSNLSAATSVSSFRSFNLGLTAAGLPVFSSTSMRRGRSISTDCYGIFAARNCPTCGADTSITPKRHSNDTDAQPAQPEHSKSSDEQESFIHGGGQDFEQNAPPSGPADNTPASRTPRTSDCATSSRTTESNHSDKETALERHEWEVIERITDESLKQLLQDVVNQKPTRNVSLDDCHIESRFRGGYNHIAMMSVFVNKRVKQYVFRIPAIGTKARWREGDAHNMRCEVSLTKYLHAERVVPVPKIVAFSDKLDTVIGAPYILMKRLQGRPAQMIWYDEPGNRTYETTSNVTTETEVKRRNFLRSLAFQMSKLECLRFDKIGMPDFTDTLLTDAKPKVTCAYRWKNPYDMTPEDLDSDGQIYKYGPFDSSQQYLTANIDTKWPNTHTPDFDEYPDTENMIFGVRKILDILCSHPLIATSTIDPLDSTGPESFVLSHPDLDFQNILCDDQGNVTGIIDWEGCMAMPRCAGFSAVPDFLRRYWAVDHGAKDMPHMDWQVERYVQIYTNAMREFSATGAVYTRKSAMYNAIVRAVGEGNAMDLVQKLFICIPAMRGVDAEQFQQLIGKGCPAAEAFIKEEIERLLAPDDTAQG